MKSTLKVSSDSRTISQIALFVISLIFLTTLSSASYAPAEEWNRTFEWDGYHDSGVSIQETSDHGYIIASNVQVSSVVSDIRLTKIDSQGVHQWNRTFNNGEYEGVYSVRQSSDGGYILSGYTSTYNQINELGFVPTAVWLIRTDSHGNHQWNRTYVDEAGYTAVYAEKTSDNGYMLAFSSFGPELPAADMPVFSSFGTKVPVAGLIKTDFAGNQEWIRTFNVSSYNGSYFILKNLDGSYIVVGETIDGSNTYLLTTDIEENQKLVQIPGKDIYRFNDIQVTRDGGYIATGYTSSANESEDVCIIKTDYQGNHQWNLTFGWDDCNDAGYSVRQTSDGGFIVAGISIFLDPGEYPAYLRGSDVLLIKVDPYGNYQWNRLLGLKYYFEGARFAEETSDGGYIVFAYNDFSSVWISKFESNRSVLSDMDREGSIEDTGYSDIVLSDDREIFDDFDEDLDYDESYYDDWEDEEESIPGLQLVTAIPVISMISLLLILKKRND